ncbi:MAG: hypothetical protein WBZ51_29555, partial [Xanthobacteraceae bacterium]
QIEKLLLDEWIFGRFCKLPILSRLVAQIITPVHAAPRLTDLFPKGGHAWRDPSSLARSLQ